MAVRNKDDIIQAISDKLNDDTSDDALQLLEDVTDTFNDMDSRLNDTEDWKAKYEENDKEWREKYKSRFTDGNIDTTNNVNIDNNNDTNNDNNNDTKNYTFDNLFKTE